MGTPKVSVIIPAYQSEKTLGYCLDSVIKQTYTNFEIIVVNNGSTDKTSEIIDQFSQKDHRVKPIKLAKNCKPSGGRNAGIRAAKGEYIAFLDADDEWMVDKLSKQIIFFQQYPDFDFSFTDSYQRRTKYSDSVLIQPLSMIDLDKFGNYLLHEIFIYEIDNKMFRPFIYRTNVINLSTVMIRRNPDDDFLYFDETLFGIEDLDLWVRLTKMKKFSYMRHPTAIRHFHEANTSGTSEAWLSQIIKYYQKKYKDPAYSDLRTLSKECLVDNYKRIIVFLNKNHEYKKLTKYYFQSVKDVFNLELLLLLLFSPFGNKGYEFLFSVNNTLKKVLR